MRRLQTFPPRLGTGKIAPSNFPDEIIQLHTPTLLWVSAPHFSNDNHDFPRDPGITRMNLSEAIRHDLKHMGLKSGGARRQRGPGRVADREC